jgi:hypothetical protein
MFDPMDGTLSLRRFFVEHRQSEHSLSVPNSVPGIGGTSISLPSRPSFGLASSPPPSSNRASALSAMMERPVELHARESEIATWNLRRARGWEPVRGTVTEAVPAKPVQPRSKTKCAVLLFVHRFSSDVACNSWVWQAELQTSSSSHRILPRSVYLVHQFAFFALGEDYQGLVRRYRLDVSGPRITVRREVAVSALASGAGDALFAQRAGPASFDESLSSAISSSLEVGAGSPPVIPMYPNGGMSGSYKAAIPIGRVAEGVSEGFARVRREIGRVRSPRVLPRVEREDAGTGAGVPLEFDEEDEDFVLDDGLQETQHREHEADAASASSGADADSEERPRTAPGDDLDLQRTVRIDGGGAPGTFEHLGGDSEQDGAWRAWEHAVAEAEPFDEISAVGFMDEEQEAQKEAERERTDAGAGAGGGKKRRKRGARGG